MTEKVCLVNGSVTAAPTGWRQSVLKGANTQTHTHTNSGMSSSLQDWFLRLLCSCYREKFNFTVLHSKLNDYLFVSRQSKLNLHRGKEVRWWMCFNVEVREESMRGLYDPGRSIKQNPTKYYSSQNASTTESQIWGLHVIWFERIELDEENSPQDNKLLLKVFIFNCLHFFPTVLASYSDHPLITHPTNWD